MSADYLTTVQVATTLNVARSTAHRLILQGRFANAWRDGVLIRVPRSDVEAYIAARRIRRAS